MFRAMVVKEWRETRGIALLGLAAYAYLLAAILIPQFPFGTSHRNVITVPFVRDIFVVWFVIISVVMAIALGLRQTLGESIRGTYPFLLHRPASRRWLIGVKLCFGMALYLICGAAPILVYGVWAATPGTHASPFEWSMTATTLAFWFSMTLLYLGAFLSGIRPGRWYGSRLLPLVAAGVAVYFALLLAFAFGGVLWPCLAIFVADVWVIGMILFVARTRDYP